LRDLKLRGIVTCPSFGNRPSGSVAHRDDGASRFRLLESGSIKAGCYLLAFHRDGLRSLSRYRYVDFKTVAKRSLRGHRLRVDDDVAAFLAKLNHQVVSFGRTNQHADKLAPQFAVTRPTQPLGCPSRLCIAGKRGDSAKSI